MQTQTLFMMAQSSPHPQSVNTAIYARVNPLLSSATSSSSSGELHLYIDSDTSSPSGQVRPPSSSQELLLQGDHTVADPPPIFTSIFTQLHTQRLPQH